MLAVWAGLEKQSKAETRWCLRRSKKAVKRLQSGEPIGPFGVPAPALRVEALATLVARCKLCQQCSGIQGI